VIRVTVEVGSGAVCSIVAVRAENIWRAVEIAKERNPSCDARVAIPIDPEGFFVSNPAAATEVWSRESKLREPGERCPSPEGKTRSSHVQE
jgi:hypothetical protein